MLNQALIDAYRQCRARGNRATPALRMARQNVSRNWQNRPAGVSHGDILRKTMPDRSRRVFVVAIVPDSDHGAPWVENDGYGHVTDWTTRDKLPGELTLVQDGPHSRFYDFAAACRIARADGWNSAPLDVPGETKKARAAKAAKANYEYLRSWCNDVWHYVGVVLFEIPRDSEEYCPADIVNTAPFGRFEHFAIWGIESHCYEYQGEIALELLQEA